MFLYCKQISRAWLKAYFGLKDDILLNKHFLLGHISVFALHYEITQLLLRIEFLSVSDKQLFLVIMQRMLSN